MAVFKSRFAGGTGRGGGGVAPRDFHGVDMARIKVNIPSAARDSNDEQILLYKFPDDGDCFLILDQAADLRVAIDTVDAGTNSTWSLGIGDSDGVIDAADVLIANSTVGQTASGEDLCDTADVGAVRDVSGKYLIWDMTAAPGTAIATTATANVAVDFKVLFGKRQEVDSGVS